MSRPSSWSPFRQGPLVALLLAACGCAANHRAAHSPDALRAAVARRAPDLDPREIVVPFEVEPQQVELARRLLSGHRTERGLVRGLVRALFDPEAFGLRYAPVVTASARETLRSHEGNCLSLASVFVGLARSLGYEAYYIDASARVSEMSGKDAETVVNAGHITAAVQVGNERWYLDFDRSPRRPKTFRQLDDLEALAHFYNNRGYERMEAARLHGDAIDWRAAAHDFALATRIEPAFARAWNNLGIAEARRGRRAEAEAAYLRAIAADGTLAAPLNNLGNLYAAERRPADAVALLEEAVRLEPEAAHSHYNLGRALLLAGDAERARGALERAAELRNEGAGLMLGKLAMYERRTRRAVR